MEITKDNFSEQIVNIKRDLEKACFVGFDAEFTAILTGECFKHRLFDTNEERYDRIKTEVSKMIMTQIGLTMFQYNREHDSYLASCYTFHLCPQVFGDINQSFIFQASTLRFLCRHNFNFNKFIYEGIPYLSMAEEANIRQNLNDKNILNILSNQLEMSDEKMLQEYCSEVSKWLVSSDEGTMYLDVQNPVLRYLVHCEVRLRFPNVLTTDSLGNSNKILIYRDQNVEGATAASIATLEENLMNYLLGFSQIISLLKIYKKPIVGHNIFLDLVLLHNQFIGPLPKKYSTFKKNLNDVLPIVFDTKYISHEMSRRLTLDEVWKSNALSTRVRIKYSYLSFLYEFFAESKCKKLQIGSSKVKLNTPFGAKQTYHEAGWDSFCSGYCLTRLGHWAACENSGKYRPVGPTETLAALAPYANKANVIRAAIPYMNLVGEDPPRHRPELLHIKTLREHEINVGQLACTLAAFGSIDIKPYGTKTALIAANAQHTVDKILKQFRDSKDYKISKYNVYRNSVVRRMAMWAGAFITGSVVLLFLRNKAK